jgi:hypothetical protein
MLGRLISWFVAPLGKNCSNPLATVWWQNIQKWREVKSGECSEVKTFGEIFVLSLIYRYLSVCRFCVVHCLIIICFSLLFFNLLNLCSSFLSFFMFIFYFVHSLLSYCFVYFFSFCKQLFLYYFCTSFSTNATGWKPNGSKYHIPSHHNQRHRTHSWGEANHTAYCNPYIKVTIRMITEHIFNYL